MKNIFDEERNTISPEKSSLPKPIRDWVTHFAGQPLYKETRADCEDCPLMKKPVMEEAHHFIYSSGCCTYIPRISNFQIGALFCDTDPALDPGRKKVRHRIASRRGVTPVAVRPDQAEKSMYKTLLDGDQIGLSDSLECPYHSSDGKVGCSIWKYRPGTCATWFCRHVRGASGKYYWRSLERLLNEIELNLSHQCLLVLGLDDTQLGHLFPTPRYKVQPDPCSDDLYPKVWGKWYGKEEAFYKACAEYVDQLSYDDILALGAPKLQIRHKQFAAVEAALHSDDLPKQLIPNRILAKGDGVISHVIGYSKTDPVAVPTPFLLMLQCFQPEHSVADAMIAAKAMGFKSITKSTIKTLLDFRILVDPDKEQDPGL